jgi:hypothetical protein
VVALVTVAVELEFAEWSTLDAEDVKTGAFVVEE